jgi:hypothetical protein
MRDRSDPERLDGELSPGRIALIATRENERRLGRMKRAVE